jgi:ribosomal protein S18 acetylase RimI-like enzyme
VRRLLQTSRGTAVWLRPASPGDEPFLDALYTDRRMPELVPLGWDAARQRAFLAMQFQAQQAGYAASYPVADHWLVGVGTEAVGRLLVDRGAHEHRVVDIVIRGDHRRRGIGTALMAEVMGDAAAARLPVGLMVLAHDDRLVGWYLRLGFVSNGQQGPNLSMAWSPTDRESGG